jgi:hypothetical protein
VGELPPLPLAEAEPTAPNLMLSASTTNIATRRTDTLLGLNNIFLHSFHKQGRD